MTEATLTETLGAFLAEAGPPPESALERARVNLVHNLAVAMAARAKDTAAPGVAERRAGASTLLSTGRRSATDWAALANGALMAVRSQDDTHLPSTSHPGAPVTAAALAVAEAEGASGAAFLDALVFGYEILGRVGRDFDKEVSARGLRAAAVWSGFGAAAAAARLMRLGPEAASHALALTAHQAGGLLQVWKEGSPEFPFHLGFGARNGVVAAELAAAGARAGRGMLDGPAGLYAALGGVERPPLEALEGLGEVWQVEEVTVKPFPACAVLQGPLDLILGLRPKIGDAAVERCILELSPFEATFPGIDNAGPHFPSSTATKMSAQFCLAVALIEDRLAFDDLSRLDDPAILGLAARISVRADPALAERQSRIMLDLSDGRRVEGAVDTPAGRPDLDEVRAFVRRIAPEIGAGASEVDAFVDAVAALPRASSVAPVLEATLALVGGGSEGASPTANPHPE